MPVRKQCKSRGCKASPRCDHEWWLDVMYRGKRHRMRVNEFALNRGAERTVSSKQEAEKVWEPLFVGEIVAGKDPRHRDPGPRVLTVNEFIPEYRKLHCEAQQLNMDSLRQRLDRIKERFGHLAMRDLERPGPIEDFKADLMEDELANATVNRYLSQLRHMINWAIGRGYMSLSPFYNKLTNRAGVRLLKGENQRTRRLQDGEETALLEAADTLYQRNRVDHEYVARIMRARIEIALDFGLRRGEMLKVRNRDIDWQGKPEPVLTIEWGNAKSRRSRKIAVVSPRVVKWLKSRRVVGGADGHPYGDNHGGPIKDFRAAWLSVLELAEITVQSKKVDGDLRWHDLRHECGSRLAERGVDVRKVQELLGHANITTTQRYFNTSTHAVGQAMKMAMGW